MYSGKMQRTTKPIIGLVAANDYIHRKCAQCEEEENRLQKKDNGGGSVSSAPSMVNNVLNSSLGRSMDAGTRSFMESRFSYDFSDVRIHDNEKAAKSADSINALAYTSGNNIVFNSGQYSPSSDPGRKLLAHELTHVVQQGGNENKQIQPKLRVENPKTALPGSPAKEHWEEIRDYITTLSSDFDVSSSGTIAPKNAAACTSPVRTVDKCLCDMHNAADDWKIQIKEDDWPQTDETNKRILIHSTRSDIQFGAWGGGAQNDKRIDQPMWRVLGHEVCGHAWLMQQGTHPSGPPPIIVGGRIMSRPSHDPTVAIENQVAKDVQGAGADQRGSHADKHSGESFGRVTIPDFATNSADSTTLPTAIKSRIDTIEKFMKATVELKADIIGHADSIGPMSSNVALSKKRADRIKAELVARGISSGRFNVVKGVGEAECPTTVADASCRKVEVFMYIFEKSSLMFP